MITRNKISAIVVILLISSGIFYSASYRIGLINEKHHVESAQVVTNTDNALNEIEKRKLEAANLVTLEARVQALESKGAELALELKQLEENLKSSKHGH